MGLTNEEPTDVHPPRRLFQLLPQRQVVEEGHEISDVCLGVEMKSSFATERVIKIYE